MQPGRLKTMLIASLRSDPAFRAAAIKTLFSLDTEAAPAPPAEPARTPEVTVRILDGGHAERDRQRRHEELLALVDRERHAAAQTLSRTGSEPGSASNPVDLTLGDPDDRPHPRHRARRRASTK